MKLPAKTQTWTESCSGLGTGPVPIAANISPEYFEKEREAIFSNSWLNVGRIEEVPRPGDYFVKDLAILNSSVLVVRGKDEEIRAFHNVCKHRGNRLATGSGSTKQFTCGFHGWTYALDGQLAFVPDQDQFFSLDRSAYGLTPIAAQLWQGFIFICTQPRPAESLEEWLGSVDTVLVNGKIVMEHRKMTTVNEEEVYEQIQQMGENMIRSSGLKLKSRWQTI